MKIPQLKRKLEVKKYHGYEIKDEFSWIHQKNILEVLKDSSKLNPEVRKYLEEENAYTKLQMKDTEKFQKKLFQEIKGRIKLDDESLHFLNTLFLYLKFCMLHLRISCLMVLLDCSGQNKKIFRYF